MPTDMERRDDILRTFFAPLLTKDVFYRMAHDPSASTLLWALTATVEELYKEPIPIHYLADFLELAQPVFSQMYLDHLRHCALRFDRITGETTYPASDIFFARDSFQTWVERIGFAMALTAERTASIELDNTHPPTSSQEAPALPAGPESSSPRTNAGALPSLLAVDAPNPVLSDGCPIVDIKLTGRTIKEAWMANALTKAMEDEAEAPIRRNGQWQPDATTLPVYHGTGAPTLGSRAFRTFANYLAYFDTTPQLLEGNQAANQVVPEELPVVWTSFSPLRSFLWAVFKADVVANIPSNSAVQAMAASYQCPRPPPHEHKGVRLIRYCPFSPGRRSSISNMAAFTLADGLQDDWHQRLRQQPISNFSYEPNQTREVMNWQYFRELHGQPTGTSWPEVFHCHEERLQTRMLTAFTKQLWRTVWFGRGIQGLHASRDSAMSISLTIIDDTKPKTNEPADTDTSKGGRKH